MKFDKETILVCLVAAAVILGWFFFYPRHQAEKAMEQARVERQTKTAVTPAPSASVVKPSSPVVSVPAAVPEKIEAPAVSDLGKLSPVTISSAKADFTFNPVNGALSEILLKCYNNAKDNSKPVVFHSQGAHMPLEMDFGPDVRTAAANASSDPRGVRIVRTLSNGLMVVTEANLAPEDKDDPYRLSVLFRISNPTDKTVEVSAPVLWTDGVPPTKNLGGDKLYSERHNLDYCLTSSNKVVSLDPTAKESKFESFGTDSSVSWIGATNKYFASLLFTDRVDAGKNLGVTVARTYLPDPDDPKEKYVFPSIGVKLAAITLAPGAEESLSVDYYFGPKEMAEIAKLPGSVVDAMHISYFSWFEFLARPMVRFLVYLNSLCHSYGLAIILLTIIVRVVFWPVTQKANNSMRKMQKLQPKMKEIREKYKDNPQEMNQRMMELYRTEKVSPLGGCLPILLQMPVFFALYSALDSAVELRQVSFLWATDLAKPDLIGPQITLPFLGAVGIHPLAIAMTLLMLLQQKMTPTNVDPMQQKIMMLMPVIMLVMLYNLPSGLTLYWTVSQVFSILQMKYGLIIAKREEAREASASPNKKTA